MRAAPWSWSVIRANLRDHNNSRRTENLKLSTNTARYDKVRKSHIREWITFDQLTLATLPWRLEPFWIDVSKLARRFVPGSLLWGAAPSPQLVCPRTLRLWCSCRRWNRYPMENRMGVLSTRYNTSLFHTFNLFLPWIQRCWAAITCPGLMRHLSTTLHVLYCSFGSLHPIRYDLYTYPPGHRVLRKATYSP